MTDVMNVTMWWSITDDTLFNSQRSVLYESPLVTLASFVSATWRFSVFQSALFKGPASARDSCRLLIHSSEGSALLFIHTIVILRLPSLWSVNYTSIGIWHLWTCHADRVIKMWLHVQEGKKKKLTEDVAFIWNFLRVSWALKTFLMAGAWLITSTSNHNLHIVLEPAHLKILPSVITLCRATSIKWLSDYFEVNGLWLPG